MKPRNPRHPSSLWAPVAVAGAWLAASAGANLFAEEAKKVDPVIEMMFPSAPGMPYYVFPAVDMSSSSPFNLGTAPRTAPSAVSMSSSSPFSSASAAGGQSRSVGIVNNQVNTFAAGPQSPVVSGNGPSAVSGQTTGAQQSPPPSGGAAGTPAGTPGSTSGSQAARPTGGGTVKHHTGGTASTPAPSASADKQPISLAEQNSLIHFGMTAGYYSHYMFRGQDVGYRTGIDANNSSAFAGASASLTVGNFALGAWYMNSLDSYVPGGAGLDGSFGHLTRSGRYLNDLDFRTPARVRYQEYDLFANYTFKLRDDLFFTPGMNFYFFNDGRFWQNKPGKPINSTVEAAASLTYTGIPHLVQSLNYFYDFEAFKGGYLEYKLATKPITLYKGHNGFAIGLVPSVTVAYDFHYTGTNYGWNHIEPGIDVPIAIADGLTLNLGLRDSMDFGSSNGQKRQRADDRLYFLASLNFTFPNGSSAVAMSTPGSGKDGKSIAPDASIGFVEHGPWRVSVGAGVRNISSAFNVGAAAPYNMSRLYRRQKGGGDLGFASDTRDAHYLDGTVYSGNSSGYTDGTTDFSFNNASQATDPGSKSNRQISYHSERFSYLQSSHGYGSKSVDDDQPVYPYLSLSREVAHIGKASLSVGLGYSYSRSSQDSGMHLSGLQTVTQRQDSHTFTYDIDEINTFGSLTPGNYRSINANPNDPRAAWVVLNGSQYTNYYGGNYSPAPFQIDSVVPDASPQHAVQSASQEVARVAAFRSSKLELDLHTLSLPVDLSVNLTNRITARLSVGATMNVFDAEMQTDTYYQLLNPQGGVHVSRSGRIGSHEAPYWAVNDTTGIPPNLTGNYGARDTQLGNLAAGSSPQSKSVTQSGAASSSNAGQRQSAVAATGGKGSEAGQSRNLPGKTLAHYTNRYNDQHIEWGVFGQLSLEFDLDQNKHWFLETYARYDYVGKFGISDGSSSVLIDASSWGAGIGLGYRF